MKFFLTLLFLSLALPGFGQEEASGDRPVRPEELEQRVHVLPSAQPETPSQTAGEAAPQVVNPEDADVNELEASRKKQAEVAVGIDQTSTKLKESVLDLPGELQKLGYSTIDSASMMDKRVVELMRTALKNNPLRNLGDNEVRNLILEKTQGGLRDYLSKSPKLMALIVELVKDEKAMPSAIGLFLKKDDLKTYFFIWLFIMIFGWALKKFWLKKQTQWAGFKMFLIGMLISLSGMMVSLSVFYNMFHEELSPTASIIVKHWRRRNL